MISLYNYVFQTSYSQHRMLIGSEYIG